MAEHWGEQLIASGDKATRGQLAWLRLLPFTPHPARLSGAIAALPPQQRVPRFIEEMVCATAWAQTSEIEEALFTRAENDAAFYANYAWRDAVRRRGTPSSARRFLDLIMEGKIDALDGWRTSQEIERRGRSESGGAAKSRVRLIERSSPPSGRSRPSLSAAVTSLRMPAWRHTY